MYYIYYLEPDFEPIINKDMNNRLERRDLRIQEELALLEERNKKIEAQKEKEIKKEEEIKYEVPEELKSDAPFRKSKYIVDDEDEGE
jgi:hypothetical protein